MLGGNGLPFKFWWWASELQVIFYMRLKKSWRIWECCIVLCVKPVLGLIINIESEVYFTCFICTFTKTTNQKQSFISSGSEISRHAVILRWPWENLPPGYRIGPKEACGTTHGKRLWPWVIQSPWNQCVHRCWYDSFLTKLTDLPFCLAMCLPFYVMVVAKLL